MKESDPSGYDLEKFFVLSLDLFSIAGMDGYFKLVNPAFERSLGWTSDELRSRPFIDFVHPDDRPSTLAEAERFSTGAPTLSFENRYRCRDGSYKTLVWNVFPQKQTDLVYAVARDVTADRIQQVKISEQTFELERTNRRLGELAALDPLTEVGNRRALESTLRDRVALHSRTGMPLSFILLDVDHFKNYNDAFGHLVGDAVLVKIARTLSHLSRNTDLVARYGGDEFAVLLMGAGQAGSTRFARRIQGELAGLAWHGELVTVSIGIASIENVIDRIGPAALMSSADRALYESKARGRNRVTHAMEIGDASLPESWTPESWAMK